jgi:hypothetical protein
MNLFTSANKALTTCLAGPSSLSARQYGSSATRAASSLVGKSTAVPGYGHFTSPLRKVHLDYHCDSVAQRGLRLVQNVYATTAGCSSLLYPLFDSFRAFIRDDLVEVAKANPDVEFVVRRLKQGKAALLRGHYGTLYLPSMSLQVACSDKLPPTTFWSTVNGRDKVVCVNSLDRQQVANKVSPESNSSDLAMDKSD